MSRVQPQVQYGGLDREHEREANGEAARPAAPIAERQAFPLDDMWWSYHAPAKLRANPIVCKRSELP
jgi:hypothetical protein